MSDPDGAPGGAVPLFAAYDGIVLDVDGVLLHGDEPVPGAAEAIACLRQHGTGFAVVTNNASRRPQAVGEALRSAGVAVDDRQVVTSAVAAAELLDEGTRCLVIGMDGLVTALRERGCVLVHEPDEAEAVVVGWDRELVWDDLRRATLALTRGARFLAANADVSYPAPEGVWPGNGAVLAALSAASGRSPEVAGKPEPAVFRTAASRIGVPADGRLLMVGDRPDTDLQGAVALGWDTALVLSGITAPDAVQDARPRPTWVLDDVRGLLAPPPEAVRSSPVVREMRDADVEAVIALWDVGGMLAYTHEPERDLALARAHAPDLVLVAEADGRVAATLVATYDGRRGWLQRLVVDPGQRRRGLGRQLVAEAERRLASRGAPQVNLLVFEGNTGAAGFWDRLGYEQGPLLAFRKKRLE